MIREQGRTALEFFQMLRRFQGPQLHYGHSPRVEAVIQEALEEFGKDMTIALSAGDFCQGPPPRPKPKRRA